MKFKKKSVYVSFSCVVVVISSRFALHIANTIKMNDFLLSKWMGWLMVVCTEWGSHVQRKYEMANDAQTEHAILFTFSEYLIIVRTLPANENSFGLFSTHDSCLFFLLKPNVLNLEFGLCSRKNALYLLLIVVRLFIGSWILFLQPCGICFEKMC